MKYELTMLHGAQELKEFGDRFDIDVRAFNRLAYVIDRTEQILFYVDAAEKISETTHRLPENRSVASAFELVVSIRRRFTEQEEYAKCEPSFMSAIGELDRVYRRFLAATEMIELPEDDVPVEIFSTLRGMLVGMGIPRITD